MKLTLATISATLLSVSCAGPTPSTSALQGDDDLIVIDVSDDLRPEVSAMLASLGASQSGGSLGLTDLTRIVRVQAADAGKLAAAYPDPMTVTCDGGVCLAVGEGEPAKARTVADTPALSGVSIGVRASVSSRFVVDPSGKAVTVCDIDGVYFQKLIVRKNLKAFRADLTSGPGQVKVWLSGATGAPTCGGEQ